METNVVYFSPSGSCKKIADYLGERIPQTQKINITPYAARLTPIKAAEQNIFIFPVYNGAIPAACADYLQMLNGEGKRACILCVYGGVFKGNALVNAAALLKKAGFKTERGGCVAAPHTYAEKKINLLTESRLNGIYEELLHSSGGKTLKAAKAPKGWQKQTCLKKFTGACKVNKTLCAACGLCKNICPVNAIDDNFISGKRCVLCGACVNVCPASARKIKFYTPVPPLFIKLQCKTHRDEFYNIL